MVSALMAYQVLLFASGLACLLTGLRAWWRRDALGAEKLLWLNVGAFWWITCALGASVFRARSLTWISARLTIPAVALTVVSLLAFTLEYTGHGEHLDRRTYGLLAIEPLVASALAVTNGSHELLWIEGPRQADSVIGFAQTFQIGFYLHTLYSYALLVGVVVYLGQFALRSDFLYQRQVFAVFFALFAPWVGNALFIFTPLQYDLTQVGFAVTGVSLGWAITSVGFLDITPVARDTVVDTLEAGVFVVDTNERLVDINQRGRELLALEGEHVTGRQLLDVLDSFPGVAAHYRSIADQREPDSFEFEVGDRAFKVRVSPLFDDRDALAGRVFLVQEITDQVERQQQLEQRNKQLDRFASVVSHDLRNPLNIASSNLELVRQHCDDEHLDTIADAHERMERIIADVLTLSRLEVEDVETSTVDLGTVAKSAWQTVDTKQATLRVTTSDSIVANRPLLTQVFENLFRNAVEHGGPAVTVTVGTFDQGDRRGFFVADDGRGIPADDKEAIFDDGVSQNPDGTGLGLTIVEQIADVHDWTVTATESATGGARFEVSTTHAGPPTDEAVSAVES